MYSREIKHFATLKQRVVQVIIIMARNTFDYPSSIHRPSWVPFFSSVFFFPPFFFPLLFFFLTHTYTHTHTHTTAAKSGAGSSGGGSRDSLSSSARRIPSKASAPMEANSQNQGFFGKDAFSFWPLGGAPPGEFGPDEGLLTAPRIHAGCGQCAAGSLDLLICNSIERAEDHLVVQIGKIKWYLRPESDIDRWNMVGCFFFFFVVFSHARSFSVFHLKDPCSLGEFLATSSYFSR